MPEKGYKPKQAITHFYCRPCGEYHEKEHPHYDEMKERARQQKRKRTLKAKARTRK